MLADHTGSQNVTRRAWSLSVCRLGIMLRGKTQLYKNVYNGVLAGGPGRLGGAAGTRSEINGWSPVLFSSTGQSTVLPAYSDVLLGVDGIGPPTADRLRRSTAACRAAACREQCSEHQISDCKIGKVHMRKRATLIGKVHMRKRAGRAQQGRARSAVPPGKGLTRGAEARASRHDAPKGAPRRLATSAPLASADPDHVQCTGKSPPRRVLEPSACEQTDDGPVFRDGQLQRLQRQAESTS